MAKGEYEFPILVTCLLTLGLQIHNPFLQRPVVREPSCICNGDDPTAAQQAVGSAANAAINSARSAPVGAQSAMGRQAPPAPSPAPVAPPAVYRRGPAASASSDDLLREQLESIQVKAKEQQATLAAAGRMPPASPILQQLRDAEEGSASAAPASGAGPLTAGMGGGVPMQPPPASAGYGGSAAVAGAAGTYGAAPGMMAQDAPMLRSRSDLGRFLDARQPRGLGVVLGVGRGDFALKLLNEWRSSQGLYLVDPYIHIWRGYDDPANLPDNEHQMVFEDLRNRLTSFEGRYVLVRDFSHSFGELYTQGGQTPGPPTFVYIDANHAEQAVARDLEIWWALLAPGGVLAGSTYKDDGERRIGVRSAVDKFVARQRMQLHLTHDDSPPSWFVFKP